MSGRYAHYQGLKVALAGKLLTVTLDNPPMNSIDYQLHPELAKIWRDAGEDPEVRCIVFTGAGDRAFSAGGDLNMMVETYGNRDHWEQTLTDAKQILLGLLECPKPIIARINGHAMGLGATIALAADITIMVEDAKIADSHVHVGLATGDGGALLWPHLCGMVAARRHLLSGDPLTGAQAAAIELITEAVPRDALNDRVQHWVQTFLSRSPIALQMTKATLNLELIDKTNRFLDEMLRLENVSWESADHLEAVTAMLEKRPPVFGGK